MNPSSAPSPSSGRSPIASSASRGGAARLRATARRLAGVVVLAVAAPLLAGEAGAQKVPRVTTEPVTKGLGGQQKGGERAGAQGAGRDVPPSHRPPPGMCRVWLDGVPANQQPAVTDCASAVRSRPANGRVLFGDDYVSDRPAAGSGSVPGLGPGTSGVSGPGSAPPPQPPPSAGRETPPPLRDRTMGGIGESVTVLALGGARDASRAHGPAAEAVLPELARDTTTARPVPPRGARPAEAPIPRPGRRPADRRTLDADDAPADDWEEGYAAGYEDAIRGRAPRVGGVRRGRRGAEGARGDDAGYGAVGVVPSTGSAAGPGAVVVVPQGGDPRYFNNGQYPPPGRANGTCLDRDRDGWCDDPRFGAPVCRDVDGDGRCDDIPELASAAYPSTLPVMQAALDYQQGRGSTTALRWLGTPEVVVRLGDRRASGLPARALWYDAGTNALLQIWTDRDADGVADRVEVFRGGRRVKLIGR